MSRPLSTIKNQMKKTILISIIFCFIIQNGFSQTPFEGVIIYKVETVLKYEDHVYNDYYSQKYGDTLKVYIAENGNQKREYSNTGNLGLDWTIYDQGKNEEYAKWHSMDSVFYYSCSNLVTNLEEFEEGDEKIILGEDCKSIITKSFEPKGKETITAKFYYSGNEYIIPNTYEEYKDGYLDRIYAKSNSHILRRELDLKYVYVIFEAIEIRSEKVNSDHFVVPDKIDLVKM